MEEIMGSPVQSYPNTLLMCCPTGDGAAAAVLDATDAAGKSAAKMNEFVIKQVTRDPGEYAALLGYDVIDAAGPRYRNILNRSILKVHSQDGIFE